MQIAHYNISFRGQSYTPNVYKGEHNLVSLEAEFSLNRCRDRIRLLFGGGSSFAADLRDPIEVSLGDQSNKLTVFRGNITHLSFRATCIVLDAQKPEDRLLSLHFDQLFRKQASGAIVREILSRADVQEGRIENGIALAYYPLGTRSSGYEHICALAEKNDFIFYTDAENHFTFARPRQTSARRSFAYDRDILDFKHLATIAPYEKFVVYGEGAAGVKGDKAESWLHATPSDYQGETGKGNPWRVEDPVLTNKQSAQEESRNLAAQFQRRELMGEIRTLGAADVFPGDCIAITGCPMSSFNRTFLVTSARHLYNRIDGFISNLRFSQIG